MKLRTLDTASVLEQAKAAFPDAHKITLGDAPYAMRVVGERTAVICNEGVGWWITDESPLSIPIYVTTEPGTMMIAPRAMCELSPAEVLQCATGAEVDLVDLVRTFGSRLEQNFWIWHRELSA